MARGRQKLEIDKAGRVDDGRGIDGVEKFT
jgi:hypothetical protein